MIIIVETNFIVEVVIDQDQSSACEEIFRLSSPPGNVHLVIPAFSFAEAGMMIERRRGERKILVSELAGRAKNPRGSRVHARYANALEELRSELLRVNELEDQRFFDFSDWIDRVGSIALTDKMISEAIVFRQAGVMTKFPDAIVLASVLGYLDDDALKGQKICFVTPDNEFANPRIVTLLRGHGCSLVRSFADAVAWVQKYSSPSN
jgi:hypothetical protein